MAPSRHTEKLLTGSLTLTNKQIKRKKMGHTAVSDIESSSVILLFLRKEPEGKTIILFFNRTVNAKTDINQIETKKLKLFRKYIIYIFTNR